MLNYMKSEFFRMARNRSLYVAVLVCGALMMALVVVLKLFSRTPGFPYANTRYALSNVYMQMNMLLMVVIMFCAFMHGNEDKQHTMKHSVAFGIKRSTIYIGRFFVQALISCMIYLVLVVSFTIFSYAMLPHANVGELEELIRISIGSCTCLLAALAVTHFFLMNTESQSTAYVAAIAILVILPSIVIAFGRKIEVLRILSEYFPVNAISASSNLVYGGTNEILEVVKALLIGTVWTIAFCVIGIKRFQRMEIK